MSARGALSGAILALLAIGVALGGGVDAGDAALLARLTAAVGVVLALSPGLGAQSPVVWGSALSWSALALVALSWSPNFDAGLDAVTHAACLAVALMLGAALRDPEERRRFTLGLALLGAGVAGWALAGDAPGARAAAPFRNPNHLAAWLIVPGSLSLVALLWCDLRRRGERESAFLWFGLVGLIGAALAATESRGVALAFTAAGACLALMRAAGPRRVAPWVGVAGMAAAVLLVVLPLRMPDALPFHTAGGESSAGLRWAVFATSGRAALASAPLGVGLGGFPSAFEAHRPEGLSYAARFAHNDPLHGLVELGLPFLIVTGITVAMLWYRASGRLAFARSRVSWGAVLATLGLAAHSLVDFPLRVPGIALLGAVVAGLAVAGSPRPRPVSPFATRLVLLGLSGLLAVSSATQGLAVRAERSAQFALAAGDFNAALREVERGLFVRPGRSALHAIAGQAAEYAYRFGGRDPQMLARALRSRSAAVEAAPHRARVWRERARTRLLAGDLERADSDLRTAEGLDPRSPVVPIARARVALRSGKRDRAARALRQALDRNPRVVPELARALLGDTDDPQLVAAAVPPTLEAERNIAAVLARAGYTREAAGAFARAFSLAPSQVEQALAAGRLFLRAGDAKAALEVLTAADRLGSDSRVRHAIERAHAERSRGS